MTSQAPARPTVSLKLLALVIFTANLGLSIIFPLIPTLAREGTNGAHTVGWIFSSYAFTMVLAEIAGGALADRVGERKVLRVAIWGYFATLLGFTVARSLPALMLTRAFEGLCVGLIVPCVIKLVVNGVDPARRGRAIGFVMGTGGLGFIIGPLLGSSLAGLGLALPFLAGASVAGICGWLSLTNLLPPGEVLDTSESPMQAALSAWRHAGQLLASPRFLALVLPLMAVKINFTTLQAALPLFGEEVLAADLHHVSWLFVVTAIAYGLVQPLAGRLADRFSTPRLITGVFVLMAVICAAMGHLHAYWSFFGVYAAFSVMQTAGVLFSMKHVGDAIGEGAHGRTFGLASALGDIGMIVAPTALMPLYAYEPSLLFTALALVMGVLLVGFWALGGTRARQALVPADAPAAELLG